MNLNILVACHTIKIEKHSNLVNKLKNTVNGIK
mgnify:CR=1 FL=1|jgi:hypothetical protein